MAESPSRNRDDGRLLRCIRDLATLNALPSMCIGRSFEESLEIILDALPTALSCDLIYLRLPDSAQPERVTLGGVKLAKERLGAVQTALEAGPDSAGALTMPGSVKLWCFEVELPIGTTQGALIAGRRAPMDPETDRVLVRSAANLVGTTLESARLLETARRKDEFLAMLGHELRNPLAPIMTAVDLLKARGTEGIERERMIIERQTRHMVRLVDDLLDVSRTATGKIVLQKELIEVAAVLSTAVEMSRAIIDERHHELDFQTEHTGLLVYADPARLTQAVCNLLNNAAKYTEPGGRISVTAHRAGDQVQIKVRDTGTGIDPEMLAHVFELFVQERQALDRARGGLGVGLWIVRTLMVLHGGTVAAESAGRGLGTTITLSIPVAAPQSAKAPATAVSTESAPVCRSLQMLVVDDNRDAAELLVDYLKEAGHTVRVAHDGASGLAAALSSKPDVVLLDIGLPIIDGYEVARRIRADEDGGQIKIIAITGYGQESDKRRAETLFDGYLIKPVLAESLEEMIREVAVPRGSEK
jgi:signal transduction histidine kinase